MTPRAAKFSRTESLRDGRRVEIRALRHEDRNGLEEAVGRASVESLRRRFFLVKRHFSEQEIEFFSNIDFVNHVALVVVAEESGQPHIVGGGRYVVLDPGQAEVAFAVIDEYQGQGIGAALMRHLAAIARDAGLTEFVAEVLPENTQMLNVFRKSGLHPTTKRDAGIVHVTLKFSLSCRTPTTRERCPQVKDPTSSRTGATWRWLPARWLAEYRAAWVPGDIIAGVTLAAYAIPVSLAYAGLAGLPPQVGIYGYLLGGLGYALLGSSRQLAIGPTSAISLMIGGTVGDMAGGDLQHYAQIASLAGFTVAILCVIAWLLRLSVLVKLISDSVLVGFKAGAGLTIAMTQLPSFIGVSGGGHNFFERAVLLVGQIGGLNYMVVAIGFIAIMLLVFGERLLPGKPVALGVVALSIVAATVLGLPALGVPITGNIPAGLPTLEGPALRLRDIEGIVPLAAGCLLLSYIESVSAGRAFAAKHGYHIDPRQELLGIGAANLAAALGHGYPVAGGLSQSAVNDKGGSSKPTRPCFCFGHACALLALSHRPAGKSAESRAGGGSFNSCVWPFGFSGSVPDVACEPA